MLKSNLFEHFDYEVICNEVWQHLYSWYSADWCLPRTLVADKVNGNKIILIKVNNGGHTWPGGRQYDGKKDIGKTSRDFSATDEIWKFFKGL